MRCFKTQNIVVVSILTGQTESIYIYYGFPPGSDQAHAEKL